MKIIEKQKTILVLFLILFGFCITACSQENNLFLRQDERWEMSIRISLNMGLLPELRPQFEGFSMGLDLGEWGASGFETTLRMVASYVESRGMRASLRTGKSGGENVYKLTIKGHGWDQLNGLGMIDPAVAAQAGLENLASALPVGWSVTDLGNGQVHFVMDTMPDELGIGFLFPSKFRLHGKEIINTNGVKTGRGEVTWNNPSGRLEAVLVPGSSVNLRTAVVILIVVLSGAGIVRLLKRGSSSRKCSACGKRLGRGQDFCPSCGF